MTIFTVIFPIFAIACLGYGLAYVGVFKPAEIGAIARYVFLVAIPALLFRSLATVALPEQIEWRFLLSYYPAALAVFGLAMVAGRWFGLPLRAQGVFGLGASYSNTVLIGLPVILRALGEEATLPIFLLIAFHGAIMFFAVTAVAELGGSEGGGIWLMLRDTVKSLSRNSIVVGLLLGLLVNWLGWVLPEALDTTLSFIGRSALPCALFVLGASLTRYRLSGHLAEAMTLVGFKLLLHPLLVWLLAFYLFDLSPLWGAVAVLNASMPVGINAYAFAEKYEVVIGPMASAILLSTLLSLGSLSLLLWLLL